MLELYLRDCAHFRPRTTTVASVMRVRNALNHASHTFFQNQGFVHVEVTILTVTYTEGLSQKFQIFTVSGKEMKKEEPVSMDDTANISLETVKLSIIEKSKKIEELKRTDSNKEALDAAVHDLHKTNALAVELEASSKSKSKSKPEAHRKTENLKTHDDFFSNRALLTNSGSLHLESCASALGNVYAFGPRFHADKSESKKYLAERWMIETEIAFGELEVKKFGLILNHHLKRLSRKLNHHLKRLNHHLKRP